MHRLDGLCVKDANFASAEKIRLISLGVDNLMGR